jgi:hypothetical protein
MAELTVLIAAAGKGKGARLKGGPEALTRVAGGETVLSRQLRVLAGRYPGSRFVVVGGCQFDRVCRAGGEGPEYVCNPDHAESNVARTLALGLAACPPGPVLLCYGNLVFGPGALPELGGHSWALVNGTRPRADDVGATVFGGEITYFQYGLPAWWCRLAYLAGPERALCERLAADPCRHKHFGHEVLNAVLEHGGRLEARQCLGPLVRIDGPADAEDARIIP